ncbi:hypothetical protein KUL72_25700 [Bradyrhizobium arachidis]|uniref:hypothetical protein n=1 Tax=Bradyrhizobium TaxID=374 RepID=UPI002163F239|nr:MULTISPECIES: hypothetical protein [Bradyrhizobium]MDN4987719.1 hypothetical protein [Bradyrhizobium sp. WYCCWR 13022]UVO34841.1 hypothetical protein KUL72_25700 [Bradyrhizobium arachidis]
MGRSGEPEQEAGNRKRFAGNGGMKNQYINPDRKDAVEMRAMSSRQGGSRKPRLGRPFN